jgi:hypothetical protein
MSRQSIQEATERATQAIGIAIDEIRKTDIVLPGGGAQRSLEACADDLSATANLYGITLSRLMGRSQTVQPVPGQRGGLPDGLDPRQLQSQG